MPRSLASSLKNAHNKRIKAIKCHYRQVPPKKYQNGHCAYCGDAASGVDHVPPVSLFDNFRDMYGGNLDPYVVPSCTDCNSALNDTEVTDFLERRDLVRASIEKRFAHALSMPSWTDEELADMGVEMQSSIEATRKLKLHIMRRLNYDSMCEIWFND